MLKIKKKNNPELYQIYTIKIADGRAWTIAHLYYMFESDGYYSITYGFFDILENNLEDIKKKIDEVDLTDPFLVATVDVNPLKEWTLIGKRESHYPKVDVENNLSKSGWYNNTELGLYPKLECYFGFFPWDLIVGRTALTEITVDKKVSGYARYLKDFTRKEAEKMNFFNLVKYADRLGELKNEN